MKLYQKMVNNIRGEKQMNIRLEMVTYAKDKTIKEAARVFKTSPSVVRKWIKRKDTEGLKGLLNRSKRPINSPNKCSARFEKMIVELRLQTKKIGRAHV